MRTGRGSRLRAPAVAAGVALLAVVSQGCGGTSEVPPSRGRAVASPPVVDIEDFDRDKFSDPTTIDNRFLPLKPGTRLTYQGSAFEEGKKVSHSQTVTVTDLAKVIHGVRTVVVWTEYFSAGELVEGEIAFFAQDDEGNVWYFGEYPEDYEKGKFAGAGETWIAGLEDAQPGIFMRAAPAPGQKSYIQGRAPKIDFADHAEIAQAGQKNCVPAGCFQNVLVIQESNPDEPGAFQLKYYAPAVGEIRVGYGGPKEEEKEVLELTRKEQLTGAALTAARREALTLEDRAYKAKKALYGRTPPAEQPSA